MAPAFLDDGRPVFVVADETSGVRVLDAISPHIPYGVEKALVWCPASQTFVDPWHGAKFTRDGLWYDGPSPTGMATYETHRVGGQLQVGERREPPPQRSLQPTELPREAREGPVGVCAVNDAGMISGPIVHHLPPPQAPTRPSASEGDKPVFINPAIVANTVRDK